MGESPAGLREELQRLNLRLVEARKRLGGQARPPQDAIDEVARLAEEARAALDKLSALPPGAEAERLEVIREAVAARMHLAVVARLAAGGAWFVSLTRELDGKPRGGIYGREGQGPDAPRPRSVERRA